MKLSGWRSCLGAVALAFAAVLPAQATVVTFEDVAPSVFFDGDSFVTGSLVFSIANLTGLPGFGVVDNASAYSVFANAPVGTTGQFLGLLNDGGVVVSEEFGRIFTIDSLDFGFIAPLSGLAGGGSVGQLTALALNQYGDFVSGAWDFADDGAGNFVMATLGAADLGAFGGPLQIAVFAACLYDGNGVCQTFVGNNLGQFALDNISVQIPEPAPLALAGLALGLMMVSRRRVQAPAQSRAQA
jgi:hypothetical protein